MKKSLVASAVLAMGFAASSQAALVNDGSMMLTIDSGTGGCLIGGTYPNCQYGALNVTGGSYFQMNGNPAAFLEQGTGIILGVAQPFNGNAPSAGNPYDGSGSNVVQPWPFFNNTGTNFSSSALVAVSDTAIDMSGWRVAWGEVPSINMGTGANAVMSCGGCNIGDSYTLSYSAVVPAGDPSGFGGTPYDLYLTGTIAAVPVPAAVWLLGSGLLGLVGVARRRKQA